MITIKTEEEIGLLRENNLLVSATLAEVAKHVAPGVTTLALDRTAEEFIRSHGAVPGFLGYGGFPNTLCVSVNEQVVHGIPSDYALREGDVVSVDCGTVMKGFYGAGSNGFSVVRELVGHGLGRDMHEDPEVPNYGARGRGPLLKEGMVICIEPMINMGRRQVVFEKDGWTVRTADRKPSAHFEFAVAIRKGGPDVLTDFGIIEKAIS